MKAIIVAGGKGTRLKHYTADMPKPLIPVNGISLIERQIFNLKKEGINEFIVIIGHFGKAIKEELGDGSKFSVHIDYIEEKSPLGSAGSLFYLKGKINDDFIVIFADLIIDIDFNRMVRFHKDHNALITLFTHPNSHPFDSDLLVVDENDVVVGFDSKNNKRNYWYHNLVNAGIFVLSPDSLSYFKELKKTDMENDFVKSLINTKRVYSYRSSEYVKDAGTIDRLKSVELDLKNKIVQNRNLSNKQRCIFLDRDGTINVLKGHLAKINDFELIETTGEAIKMINSSSYLNIVITNQPIIARGGLTFKELDNIHKKMETLLGNEGAYIDGLYVCPHYPESGFEGEVKELKIDCDCRKPKIGLLLEAQRKFNIDFNQSWFIGDSELDIKCGKNAGCKTILIGRNSKTKPDYYANNLLDAVKIILTK